MQAAVDGPVSEYKQRAYVANAPTNTRWSLNPKAGGVFLPLSLAYLVVDCATDYSSTIVGAPDRSFVYVMTRTPEPEAAVLEALLEKAERAGYDRSKITPVVHDYTSAPPPPEPVAPQVPRTVAGVAFDCLPRLCLATMAPSHNVTAAALEPTPSADDTTTLIRGSHVAALSLTGRPRQGRSRRHQRLEDQNVPDLVHRLPAGVVFALLRMDRGTQAGAARRAARALRNRRRGGRTRVSPLRRSGRYVSPLRLAATSRRYVSPLRIAVTSRRYVSPLRLAVTSHRYVSPLRLAVTFCLYISLLRLAVTSRRYVLSLRLAVTSRRYVSPLHLCI